MLRIVPIRIALIVVIYLKRCSDSSYKPETLIILHCNNFSDKYNSVLKTDVLK